MRFALLCRKVGSVIWVAHRPVAAGNSDSAEMSAWSTLEGAEAAAKELLAVDLAKGMLDRVRREDLLIEVMVIELRSSLTGTAEVRVVRDMREEKT